MLRICIALLDFEFVQAQGSLVFFVCLCCVSSISCAYVLPCLFPAYKENVSLIYEQFCFIEVCLNFPGLRKIRGSMDI